MSFTLTNEQYEALISLAANGTKDANGLVNADKARQLDQFLRLIEKSNGITRYILWVQWQETDVKLPPTVQFPSVWPPELRFKIELVTRPISLDDVNKVLQLKASKPVNVLVTPDPGAEVGWTKLSDFFPS